MGGKVSKMSGFNLSTLKELTTQIVALNSILDRVEQQESVAEIFTEDVLIDIVNQFNQLLDQLKQSLPSPDKLAIDIDDGWHEELEKFDESQDVLLDTLNSLANHLDCELHDFDEKLEDLERKCETINKALVKLFISSKIEEMSMIIKNRSDQEASASDVKESLVQVANKLDKPQEELKDVMDSGEKLQKHMTQGMEKLQEEVTKADDKLEKTNIKKNHNKWN